MKEKSNFTSGKIMKTLMRFAVPVFFSLFLQALYGGVDLLVVGQFATTADVSGVATGSMLLTTLTMIITGLSMGVTILVGEKIGKGDSSGAGKAIGGGICLFTIFGLLITLVLALFPGQLAKMMHAPEAAFEHTVDYIRICGLGALFIAFYNLLGAIFRGIGDSKTPLITVSIACVINIFGDLYLVEGCGMGAAGAAIATVAAQAISVIISLFIISREKLPFEFKKSYIRFSPLILSELKLGIPVALQELLVGISFMVIQMIVNDFGVVYSAAIGVGEKVSSFLMLVPSAFMQSMSAFVAQNMGAGQLVRAKKALEYGMFTAFIAGCAMSILAFFFGNGLASIFSSDPAVVLETADYLKAYAIDCLLTCFLFCFLGYFNGREKTFFTMIQGLIGAFLVRIPVAFIVSRTIGANLFAIGLATPLSSVVQITLCLIMFVRMQKLDSRALSAK